MGILLHGRLRLLRIGAPALVGLLISSPAAAQEIEPQDGEPVVPRVEPLAEESPRVRVRVSKDGYFSVGGYVETFYAWNFNEPSNRITEFRAFDNRHNEFTVQAIALDFGFKSDHFEAKIVGQAGNGPATYYGASEPAIPGSSLTPASNASSWRYLQQAWLAWSPLPEKLSFDAGLFLSPIGPESMPTYQNNHWSHSLLFFALPFYHVGARVRFSPAPGHALRLGVYNGWNNALDSNNEKTIGLDYSFAASSDLALGAAYFTGVERPDGAPEGRAWRHLLDFWAVWEPAPRVRLLAEANGGVEPNSFGTSGWAAGNLSARVEIIPWLFAAGRTTIFWEHRASNDLGTADPIAIPAGRVASQTVTLEAIPMRGLSFKLEGRYDSADDSIFFAGPVSGDGSSTSPFVPTAREQWTATLGASAWF